MLDALNRNDKALGASGTDVVGKIHNQDDHIESLKGFEAAFIYDRMRRSDTQVRKIITAIANPIKSAEWAIEPASDETKDIEVAARITQILFKDIQWTKFLNEALTLIPHGHSVFEVVHQNNEDKEIGQYTGLAQLGFRRQPTLTEWTHDPITGKLLSVKQESTSDIQVEIDLPVEFLLMFFSEQEGDNIGFPLLRNVYGPYKRKLLAMELQFIGIERFAIPTPILKVPKNVTPEDEEYIQAIEVLRNFTSAEDSYITYPEGWELELFSNSFDPEKLLSVIKNEDENMAGAILASFLELGTGGNTGAYALSADLSDFFFSGLTYYANIIKDTINRELIPQLLNLNYGEGTVTPPKLIFSGITDNAGKELMEVLTGFTNAGVITNDEPLEDHVRRLYNLPKKVEGEIIDNGETQGEGNGSNNNNAIDNSNDDVSKDNSTLELSEHLGHTHKGTGPSIQRGQKHYHDLLDASGETTGRTTTDTDTKGHNHNELSPAKETKELKEPKENPKALIEKHQLIITDVIRRHRESISDKYIADVLRKYKTLGDKSKQLATKDIKVGGTAQFKKELKGVLTSAARASLDMVNKEVPGFEDTKLSEDTAKILKEFDVESFKFNEFSKLPRRVQLIISSQADLLTAKEASDVTDVVAFQFGSSEGSTNDIAVLKSDMKDAASTSTNSGTRDTAGANAAATIINESRNTFLLAPEVQASIASYTFVNSDPKTDICKTLADTSYTTTDQSLVKHQPPLHQNCKSYLRANLKNVDQ